MKEYHKIQGLYKRDQKTKSFIEGEFSIPEFEYLQYNKWEYKEKVDGTNIRIMFNGKEIKFGGKTDRAQMPVPLMNRLNELFLSKLDLFKETFNYTDEIDVCFYGEGYGGKIQKGFKYRSESDFVLFDIKIGRWWLQQNDMINIGKRFDLDIVPVVGIGNLHDAIKIVKDGFKSTWGDFVAEGVVARPLVDLALRNGGRIITKIKYKDWH